MRPLTRALMLELAADPAKARKIALSILTEAAAGNHHAWNLLFDRLEGKAVLGIEMVAPGTSDREALDRASIIERIQALQAKTIDARALATTVALGQDQPR